MPLIISTKEQGFQSFAIEKLKWLRGSRLVQDGLWSMVLKATNTLLAFLTTMILARLLGAEGYGIYAYAYSLILLLALPAHAGLPNLVIRETAKGMAQERPDLIQGIWVWAGRVVVILSLILTIVFGPFLITWQGGINSLQGQTLTWALLLIPLISLGNLRGAALRGLKHIVAGQMPEFFIRPVLFLLLISGSAFVFSKRFSASFAMALHGVASLIAFLIGAWMLWHFTPLAVRKSRPTTESKGWLASSAIFAWMAGMTIVINQAATILLGIFQTPDQVGIYRVAVQVGSLAAFGLQAVNQVVAPRFADLYTRGEYSSLQQLVTNSARVIFMINLIITTIFITIGRSFLPLAFGSEFSTSYPPLLILLVGQLINSATGSVGYLLNMTGHERVTAQGIAFAATLNIGLGLICIPTWGLIGAASAAAISMMSWNLWLWWQVRKVLKINSLAFRLGTKR